MSAIVGEIYVEAIGLAAPGMPDWKIALPILRGEQPYVPTELTPFQPSLLPANERRRASPTVRMAFRVAEEATRGDAERARTLATVFVSADGDLQISHRLCTALASDQRLVSPTDFHNSVHNAAAGYWSIASGAQGPSTAISAWDAGFAVGLLEAAAMIHTERKDTLLVVYDLPAPPPLWDKRPVGHAFGVSILLSGRPSAASVARLALRVGTARETTLENESLEALRVSNPAARALPLLQAIARGSFGSVHIANSNHQNTGRTLELAICAP